jgi:hypothetical protein
VRATFETPPSTHARVDRGGRLGVTVAVRCLDGTAQGVVRPRTRKGDPGLAEYLRNNISPVAVVLSARSESHIARLASREFDRITDTGVPRRIRWTRFSLVTNLMCPILRTRARTVKARGTITVRFHTVRRTFAKPDVRHKDSENSPRICRTRTRAAVKNRQVGGAAKWAGVRTRSGPVAGVHGYCPSGCNCTVRTNQLLSQLRRGQLDPCLIDIVSSICKIQIMGGRR